tara:strand:- start:2522 stop:2977 length:456 start_codon:yes stop_codon:yes gene_type:complete
MAKKIISITCLILSFSCSNNIEVSSQKPPQGVYEMRVYYTHDGKFEDIISRFENHTTKLFEKHGFTNVGYWTTKKVDSVSFADKFIISNKSDSALVYIVSFKDMISRNESWRNFIKDPEWTNVFKESRLNGPIVKEIEQVFLSPTIFSGLK